MSTKNWDPLAEIEAALRGLGRTGAHRPSGGHETMTTADWTPAVDIAETADAYLINVELTEVDARCHFESQRESFASCARKY